ncbi:MAG: DNA polymerase III subunit delta' [Motiliproteus sp.]
MNAELNTEVYQWQQPAWTKLLSLHQKQRLPHAMLLSGPQGIGKEHFARVCAYYILCQNPKQEACGSCKSCLLNQQGTHPDLVTIFPDEPGKPIKIDQIRDLNRFITSTPQQGGYRVVIISPAEEMNINAANAVLKGLEEPGDKTLFLMVSHASGRLMATIRSRCQSYPLPLPTAEQAEIWLDQQGIENAQLLLKLAGGAPLSAQKLFSDGGAEKRTLLVSGLKGVASRRCSVPEIAVQWQKEDPLQMLSWLYSLITDMIRYRSSGSADNLTNLDAKTLVIKASARIPAEKLFAFVDKIQEYRRQLMAKTNPNRQLMFEDILIYWLGLVSR